ncbi:MAG: DUF4338 domain-containing protein, partial [Colwellia sp.]|nr:DUF4338 domain-containing protein [Colwellia sp.]
ETFVEQDKFHGTCYKATNWTCLGQTKGSAKRGNTHTYHGKIKKVFVYPLCNDFRDKLTRQDDFARPAMPFARVGLVENV